jgi:hypothetical protein
MRPVDTPLRGRARRSEAAALVPLLDGSRPLRTSIDAAAEGLALDRDELELGLMRGAGSRSA